MEVWSPLLPPQPCIFRIVEDTALNNRGLAATAKDKHLDLLTATIEG